MYILIKKKYTKQTHRSNLQSVRVKQAALDYKKPLQMNFPTELH